MELEVLTSLQMPFAKETISIHSRLEISTGKEGAWRKEEDNKVQNSNSCLSCSLAEGGWWRLTVQLVGRA